MDHHRVLFAFALTLAGVVCGCGSGGAVGPRTASVSGIVTLDGKPLAGAEIHFVGDKFTGYGVTNSEGKYTLVQGAVPGANKVYISKIEGGKNIDPSVADDAEQLRTAATSFQNDPSRGGSKTAAADLPHEIVPSQYSDPQKSKLTFPVPEGGSKNADFSL